MIFTLLVWFVVLLINSTQTIADQYSVAEINIKISNADNVIIHACFGSNLENFVNYNRAFAILEMDHHTLFVDLGDKYHHPKTLNVVEVDNPESDEDYANVWEQMKDWPNGKRLPLIYGNILHLPSELKNKSLEGVYEDANDGRCSVFARKVIPGVPNGSIKLN